MEKIFCDGSTRECCVVIDGKPRIITYLEPKTVNESEYIAAITAVQLARDSGMTDFAIFTDSKLVVQQTTDKNKCYASNLAPYCTTLRGWLGADHIPYKHLQIYWIPREENPAGHELERIANQRRNK